MDQESTMETQEVKQHTREMSIMNATLNVPPGDRYVTSEPCCSTCSSYHCVPTEDTEGADHKTKPAASFLAVEPYSFVFRAPAKGRWLSTPLLTLCVREFAYVPPPHRTHAAMPSPAKKEGATTSGGQPATPPAAASTTLDHRISLPAYVEELSTGWLWLQGREAECRAAGEQYKHAIIAASRRACPTESKEDDGTDSNNDRVDVTAWAMAKQWCHNLSSSEAVDTLLATALPSLLPLRQRDTVMHRVWRQEGRMFADAPIEVLRCDLAQRARNRRLLIGPHDDGFRPALLVVNKPAGLPVHPSGRYRKNSCTSILEDIFGGADSALYRLEETLAPAEMGGQPCRAAVVHKAHGFVLMTVRIRPVSGEGVSDSDGLSQEDWVFMKRLFALQGQDPSSATGEAMEVAPLKAYVVHRLDAATSGVLLFGLDQPTARATAELISQKGSEEDMGGRGRRDAHCAKTYLATVDGKLDTDALSKAADGVAYKTAEDGWLRVDRAIGCLSFHQSLYRSPGPRRTEVWRKEQEQHGGVAAATEPESSLAGGPVVSAGKKRDAAAVAYKKERMRLLSLRGRGATAAVAGKRPRDAAMDGIDDSSPTSPERKAEQAQQEAEATYTSTLRSAVTLVKTVTYDAVRDQTLVACRLLTGRTHQLRVHLAGLGHPIAGDTKYVALVQQLASTAWKAHKDGADDEDNDDVTVFYRQIHQQQKQEQVAPEASAEAESGCCVCPDRIGLHAWRYRLVFPSVTLAAGVPFAMELVAPPHDPWMREATSTLVPPSPTLKG